MKIRIQYGDAWLSFENPVEVLTARTPTEVFQCLEEIEASDLWAAGFISYEAAGAFDVALKTHSPGDFPLLRFGLFEEVQKVLLPSQSSIEDYELGEWRPSVLRDEYVEAIAKIKDHIAAGDTYQVNYTFRLNAGFSGDPFSFFCDLAAAQRGGFGAFVEMDDFAICSASPELFFDLSDGVLTARPMKGTFPRGLTFSKDRKHAETLKNSPKDRAENIMIVDMIRNDLGRIAEPGSVETLSCFDLENYPTVWQMTSTVKGKLPRRHKGARDSEFWRALFPCASITGAPKVKTMEIIQGLEKSARGIYTGSIGFMAPNGDAQFNVAIRTAFVDRTAGTVEYGIGGGIVWDSNTDAEYEEALSKAAILTKKTPVFELIETMLWEDGGFFLLERHLTRLAESAEFFGFRFDREKLCADLRNLRLHSSARIRVLLRECGEFNIQVLGLNRQKASSTLAIAKEPVDSTDLFLYHKTTNRAVYEKAKANFPDADDVLLYNERGELTESCIANIVVELDGHNVTPPISCGLLAGTFRNELLERGDIEERVIHLRDLKQADSIGLINSVRRWRPATIQK